MTGRSSTGDNSGWRAALISGEWQQPSTSSVDDLNTYTPLADTFSMRHHRMLPLHERMYMCMCKMCANVCVRDHNRCSNGYDMTPFEGSWARILLGMLGTSAFIIRSIRHFPEAQRAFIAHNRAVPFLSPRDANVGGRNVLYVSIMVCTASLP
jgi:hypothetical protein